MQIHLTPRHLQLTAAIHQAVAEQIGSLDHFGEDILAAHVVLVASTTEKPAQYRVKVHLALPGPDIFAEDAESDLYAALEMVVAKVARQLRKRKTAMKDQRRKTTQRTAERGRLAGLPLADRRTPRRVLKKVA
jgi:putative sigma-54 modulation protein